MIVARCLRTSTISHRLCRPPPIILKQTRLIRASNEKKTGLWAKFKNSKRAMAEYGGLFLIVKAAHFWPIMYICSYAPLLAGYETPTDFIQSLEWLKKWIDVDHHLHVDPDAPPPGPVRAVEYVGQVFKSDFQLSPYFHTPRFAIDFAATFFIYEFVIAPVKWPYYFWATKKVYTFLKRYKWFNKSSKK